MNFQVWSILNEHANRRRRFDPNNKEDLRDFSYFMKYGKWRGGCPFFIEWPYQDVISMCQSKYSKFMLEKLTK